MSEMTPDPVQPDWANMCAQLMVREGVHVAFLQRVQKIARKYSEASGVTSAVDEVNDLLVEWERWFKNGKSA